MFLRVMKQKYMKVYKTIFLDYSIRTFRRYAELLTDKLFIVMGGLALGLVLLKYVFPLVACFVRYISPWGCSW